MRTNLDDQTFRPINSQTGDDVSLALQELWLTGRILPVGATLHVRHVFKCAESTPIEMVYAFALPRDAALRSFRIVGEGFTVSSELRPTVEAEKIYEEGIESGSLSSLASQYRDGVVNLNVGNIRPDETVVVHLEILAGVELWDDSLRFRFPFTLAPTYHRRARAIEAGPGVGEMELPAEFGDVMLPQWFQEAEGLHRVGFDLALDLPGGVEEVGSPSHAIRVRTKTDELPRVSLATAGDLPNRDLVLDVRIRSSKVAVTGGIAANGREYFALVVPSSKFEEVEPQPSRTVFVLDRSGSMGGAPIDQARQAIEACLGALSPTDQFGIVAFDNLVEVMPGCQPGNLLAGSRENRDAARQFLETVDARGGTELIVGIQTAAKLLGKEGGDILVLTDGQVAGTDAIIARARATGIRIHCLGIGSASQDRFLTLLARQTGGLSRFQTVRERVDLAAIELFASINQSLASDISVVAKGIELAPTPPSTVFAGRPLVIFGESGHGGEKSVQLTWCGDRSLTIPLPLVKSPDADLVRLLQGSRLITDAEAEIEDGAGTSREASRRQKKLERLSTRYGLASQAMSLVAVVKREGDQADLIPKTMVAPVGMPEGTSFESYFQARSIDPVFARRRDPTPEADMGVWCRRSESAPMATRRDSPDDALSGLLVQLAGRLEPDGGMPGQDMEERWIATATALLCFITAGHNLQKGAFRRHVQRMIHFLKMKDFGEKGAFRRHVRRMARFLKMKDFGEDGSSAAPSRQEQRFIELIESGAPLPEALRSDCVERGQRLIDSGRISAWPGWETMEL